MTSQLGRVQKNIYFKEMKCFLLYIKYASTRHVKRLKKKKQTFFIFYFLFSFVFLKYIYFKYLVCTSLKNL